MRRAAEALVVLCLLASVAVLYGCGGSGGPAGPGEGNAGKPPGGGIANPALAYVLEGPIYVGAFDGTTKAQVTRPTGRARDYEPAWSPDGSRIAFVHRPDHSLIWGDVCIINRDGSGLSTILSSRQGANVPPWAWGELDWCPEGSKLMYVPDLYPYIDLHPDDDDPDHQDDLVIVDIATKTWACLGLHPYFGLQGVGSGCFGPDLEPATGGYQGIVAFVGVPTGETGEHVCLVKVITNASGDLAITGPPVALAPAYDLHLQTVSISPDGEWLAYPDSPQGFGGPANIMLVRIGLDDSGQPAFQSTPTQWTQVTGWAPTWAPNGLYLGLSGSNGRFSGSANGAIYRLAWGATQAVVWVDSRSADEESADWNPAWDPSKP
jgi:hypothetical protein